MSIAKELEPGMRIINIWLDSVMDMEGAIPMHDAPGAVGLELLTNGHIGADCLHLGPNESFPLHTHPGHHLIFVMDGEGTFTFNGTVYPTRPGDLYLVEANVPHAVGAGPSGHTLVSFGAPHTRITDHHRMHVLEEPS